MRFSLCTVRCLALPIVISIEGLAYADGPVAEENANRAETKAGAKAGPVVEELNLDAVKLPRRVNRDANPAVAARKLAVEARVLRFGGQFRLILDEELHFVRQTCEGLPQKDRLLIRWAAEASFADFSREDGKPISAAGIAKRVRDAILDRMREIGSADFVSTYSERLVERSAHRKQAAILNWVAQFDRELYLSAEQRDRIADAISREWTDTWEQWYLFANPYVQAKVSSVVVPCLDDEQKVVWDEIQKDQVQIRIQQNGIVLLDGNEDNEWWGVQIDGHDAPPRNDAVRLRVPGNRE